MKTTFSIDVVLCISLFYSYSTIARIIYTNATPISVRKNPRTQEWTFKHTYARHYTHCTSIRLEKLSGGAGFIVDHSTYSIVPPTSSLPRFTASPFARTRSSTVLNCPPFVPSVSLNHPRWSAMRCLTGRLSVTRNCQPPASSGELRTYFYTSGTRQALSLVRKPVL